MYVTYINSAVDCPAGCYLTCGFINAWRYEASECVWIVPGTLTGEE